MDLNGDHPHTNFRDVFTSVIGMKYHIEILSKPFTSFDAMDYGALLLLDPEEEYLLRSRVVHNLSPFTTRNYGSQL